MSTDPHGANPSGAEDPQNKAPDTPGQPLTPEQQTGQVPSEQAPSSPGATPSYTTDSKGETTPNTDSPTTNFPQYTTAPVTPAVAVKQKHRKSGLVAGIALAVAVLIGAGGGIAIYAAASHGNTRTAPGQPHGMEQGQGGHFRGPANGTGGNSGGNGGTPGGAGNAPLGQALHGDFTTPDGQGGYRTQRLQSGQVTAISATSLTVASKDNYTQTYAITNTTRKAAPVNTGDTITVVATVTGDTATADTITTGTREQRNALPPRN